MKFITNLARISSFLLLPLFFFTPSARATSVLDIGTNYRMRAISMNKVDFGAPHDESFSYFSQRAQAHIGGRFSPNIEFMTQFQALSIAGSSSETISNATLNPGGNRYPNTGFSPWVQTAYLKASQLYDWPVDLTVGRQPLTLGDGFILSDDDLGFTGLRLQTRLPLFDLRTDTFWMRTGSTLQGSANSDIYGVEITKPMKNVRYQLSIVNERDATGQTTYIRPSENALDQNKYPLGTDFRASNITRTFYDGRIESRLAEGGFLKGEFALQTGRVERSSASLGNVDLGGYGFLISGGLFTRFSKYGPIEIHGSFGIASGDSGGGKDNSFQPTHGHKYDGLERSGFGEFYGSTLYDALPSSSNPRGLPPGFSGMRVIGAGVTTHPTALLSIGIDYYVYTAQETAGRSFPITSSESSLGTELDIGVGFAYTSYLSFRGSFALFSPGKAYEHTDNARRILFEAVGHF
jgi:hypothetical protein